MGRMKPEKFTKFLDEQGGLYNFLMHRMEQIDLDECLRHVKDCADSEEEWYNVIQYEHSATHEASRAMSMIADYDYRLQLVEHLLGDVFEAYRTNSPRDLDLRTFKAHDRGLKMWRNLRRQFLEQQEEFSKLCEDALGDNHLLFGLVLNNFVIRHRSQQYHIPGEYNSAEESEEDSDDEKESFDGGDNAVNAGDENAGVDTGTVEDVAETFDEADGEEEVSNAEVDENVESERGNDGEEAEGHEIQGHDRRRHFGGKFPPSAAIRPRTKTLWAASRPERKAFIRRTPTVATIVTALEAISAQINNSQNEVPLPSVLSGQRQDILRYVERFNEIKKSEGDKVNWNKVENKLFNDNYAKDMSFQSKIVGEIINRMKGGSDLLW